MTDDLVIEARKGGPCAELGDRCRAIEAASGCFCAAVADRIEALTAERAKYESAWMTAEGKLADADAMIEAQAKDHASNNIRFAEAEHRAKAAEAERDRLREAAIALRDDMMERAEYRMDTISGEQYRIVNAGNSAWMGFCAALKGDSHE